MGTDLVVGLPRHLAAVPDGSVGAAGRPAPVQQDVVRRPLVPVRLEQGMSCLGLWDNNFRAVGFKELQRASKLPSHRFSKGGF